MTQRGAATRAREAMNRPSSGSAAVLGGASIAAAAVAIGVAQLELSGQPQPHIWSNVWLLLALALASAGVVIAVILFVLSMFARQESRSVDGGQYRQPGSREDGDDQAGHPAEPDQASAEADTGPPRSGTVSDVPLHVEQLLDGLGLGSMRRQSAA